MENLKYSDKYVCGIDEVGRGCLFGDVVACAIVMPDWKIEGVKDSKKLSPKKRDDLYPKILNSAIAIGIGRSTVEEIDELNIKNATRLAMRRAVFNLRDKNSKNVELSLIRIDAESIDLDIPQESIIKGDDLIYEIQCASIVAKVYRDSLCKYWDSLYPHYMLLNNKGYGTKDHVAAIKQYGATVLHRKLFLRKIWTT